MKYEPGTRIRIHTTLDYCVICNRNVTSSMDYYRGITVTVYSHYINNCNHDRIVIEENKDVNFCPHMVTPVNRRELLGSKPDITIEINNNKIQHIYNS